MASVLCLDINPATMAVLQRNREPLTFVEAHTSGQVVAALEHDATATEVLLLGSEVQDPLRLARHAGAMDEDLAVVIMAQPDALRSFGEAIDFLPTLAGDVSCTNAEAPQELIGVLEGAAKRTQGRRITRAQFRAVLASSADDLTRSPVYGEFLVRLLDQVPIAVVVLNSNGLIQTCNPLGMDLLARYEQDLISRPLVLLFPEEVWESLSHFLARSSATERRIPCEEFPFCSPDGDKMSIVVQATPFKGRGGDRGTLVFLQRREGCEGDEPDHLQKGVRLGEIPYLTSVGGFAGEVAHELNNELVTVVGNTDLLLRDTNLDAERRAALERVLAGGAKIAAIAGHLQAFAGTVQVTLAELDLRELVESELPAVEENLPASIAFLVDCEDASVPHAFADADQLRHAFRNLIRVSTQAIGTQVGQIRVSVGRAIPRARHLLQPAPHEELLGLQLPFLEVSDTAREKEAGRRLGSFDRRSASRSLKVDWRLAAVVGSTRSQEGLFEVIFPHQGGMACRILLPSLEAAKLLGLDETQQVTTPHAGFLIVDDDEDNLALTRGMLETQGLGVRTACGVHEALEDLRANSLQVGTVVMDAGLYSGAPEAMAEFRSHTPRLTIILCSGHPRERMEEQISALGAAAFLHKPFTVEELMEAVRTQTSEG